MKHDFADLPGLALTCDPPALLSNWDEQVYAVSPGPALVFETVSYVAHVGLELGCVLIFPVLGMQVFATPGQHSLSIVKLPVF